AVSVLENAANTDLIATKRNTVERESTVFISVALRVRAGTSAGGRYKTNSSPWQRVSSFSLNNDSGESTAIRRWYHLRNSRDSSEWLHWRGFADRCRKIGSSEGLGVRAHERAAEHV